MGPFWLFFLLMDSSSVEILRGEKRFTDAEEWYAAILAVTTGLGSCYLALLLYSPRPLHSPTRVVFISAAVPSLVSRCQHSPCPGSEKPPPTSQCLFCPACFLWWAGWTLGFPSLRSHVSRGNGSPKAQEKLQRFSTTSFMLSTKHIPSLRLSFSAWNSDFYSRIHMERFYNTDNLRPHTPKWWFSFSSASRAQITLWDWILM